MYINSWYLNKADKLLGYFLLFNHLANCESYLSLTKKCTKIYRIWCWIL